MVKIVGIALLHLSSAASYGQEINITFTAADEVVTIDSIKATNLSTNESVTLPGNATLVLKSGTGINDIPDSHSGGLLYPNPFSGVTSLLVRTPHSQKVVLRVQNILGGFLTQSEIQLDQGDHQFSFKAGSAGIYLISLITEHGTYCYKAVSDQAAGAETRIDYVGQKSMDQPALKTSKSSYLLPYKKGEIILFKCYRGTNTSIVTDAPIASKNYLVRFPACTDRDQRNYPIVTIGEQTWMAENLALLPSVSSPLYRSLGIPYYYVYNYEGVSVKEAKATANYSIYGVLYNYAAAKVSCPDGWHLPSKAEWSQLTDYLGPSASLALAETTQTHWTNAPSTATNSSGFTALPGGNTGNITGYPDQKNFYGLGETANFWSGSEELHEIINWIGTSAWYCTISTYGYGYVNWTLINFWMTTQTHHVNTKGYGYSVRCLLGAAATVTTTQITGITSNSAEGGGEVTNDGNITVTSRGVCWSTNQNPTINDAKTIDGNGTGPFSSSLKGLNPNTTYYVRAYAVNPVTTSYGQQVSLKTNAGIPTVTTTNVLTIADSSAVTGGTVTNNGGLEVTARGVCWSILRNPTIEGTVTYDGYGNGTFVSQLTRLIPKTVYYVRAYASNSEGTGYGEEKEFKTADGSILYEGKRYGFRNIGHQNWMIQNLNYLPTVYPPTSGSDISPRYYVYGYNETSVNNAKQTENYSTYGALYNLEAAKIACPPGWYLPGNSDWTELTDFLTANGFGFGGNGTDIAKSMAAKWGWQPSQKQGTPGNDLGSNDLSGFSALPAGYRSSEGEFSGLGSYTRFWITTNSDANIVQSPWLRLDNDYISISTGINSDIAGSVRCVKGGTYLAKIATSTIKDQSGSSATGGGTIIEDGGTEVTGRGVCWSTNKHPTIRDFKTIDGKGTGSFSSEIKGLGGNQAYYLRAYAVNSTGINYGAQEVILTSTGLPTVTTAYIRSIIDTSAISGGTVNSTGGYNVTARGVCWSEAENPTISGNCTTNGVGSGIFTSQMINLSAHKTYYVRAYASNSMGTGYGKNVRFTTADSSFNYEGRTYYYQTIGSQIWMTENLAYLPSVSLPTSKSETAKYYYVYGYSGTSVENAKATANYKTYGVLYNRPSVMNGEHSSSLVPSGVRGICPEGWHLPSDGEWDILAEYLGGKDIAGGKMKEPGNNHWQYQNEDATNESGFSAIPSGGNFAYTDFRDLGLVASFYSATDEDKNWNWCWMLGYQNSKLDYYTGSRTDAYSVRCIKN